MADSGEADRAALGVREASVLRTAGQRQINTIWERTQQIIAVCVSVSVLAVCAYMVYKGEPTEAMPAFMLLSNVFFLVVGTYFQRTNHTATGGVGRRESDER